MFSPKLTSSSVARMTIGGVLTAFGAGTLYAHIFYGGRPYSWLALAAGLILLLSLLLPEPTPKQEKPKPEKYHLTGGQP